MQFYGHFRFFSSGSLAPVAIKTRPLGLIVMTISSAFAIIAALLTYVLKPGGPELQNYVFTPLAPDAAYMQWSRDGKSIAYSSEVDGVAQVFLRRLDLRVPVQLTHEKYNVIPQGWANDGNHIIARESTGNSQSPLSKLLSVSTVGGRLVYTAGRKFESSQGHHVRTCRSPIPFSRIPPPPRRKNSLRTPLPLPP